MGIDQGGSKTHALIGDDKGKLFGFGTGRGACHSSSGIDAAMEGAGKAVRQALCEAALSPKDIDCIFAGMAGVDWPDEHPMMEEHLRKETGVSDVTVVNDCLIALRGGTANSPAAVVCAGSGLNCGARRPDGETYIYGFYIPDSDQGGGAIGNAAMQAVFDAESGFGPKTELSARLFDHFGLSSADDLLRLKVTDNLDRQSVLTLPMVVEKAAGDGIAAAGEILSYFGRRWARYAIAALRRLDILDCPVDVVLSGSIFKCREPILTESFQSELHRYCSAAKVINARFEPVVGAYLLGLEKLGITPIGEDLLSAQANRYPLVRGRGSSPPKKEVVSLYTAIPASAGEPP
jgi:N-acetylglucosamine kinase-like BadF-type ATPase